MTREDDQLRRLFAEIRFVDEPPAQLGTGSVEADVERARRGLRKRRLTAWSSAALGSAVIVSGVAVASPSLDLGGGEQAPVAEGAAVDAADGSATSQSPDQTGADPAAGRIAQCPAEPPQANPSGPVGFPNTRQCLLETAVKHFDPERAHLPRQTANLGGGLTGRAVRVSTKLGWSVPGEDGLGLVQVAVTGPGFAAGDHAVADLPGMMICGPSPDACRSVTVPGTDETVMVVEDDPEYGWSLAVAHERPDGSMVSVAVDNLFGNNSLVPVSYVGVTLDEAIAFVTDPALRVDEAEAAQSAEALAGEAEALADADYSSAEIVPAPEAREMTADQARAAFEACVESVPAWSDFQPEFGVWITTRSGEESLVIAARGDTKMECRDGGAALFGAPEVKGSADAHEPVSYNNMKLGRYVGAVEQVTVQPSGGPAYEAVLNNGYWFLPEALGDLPSPAIRGYDGAGELVYESTAEDRGRDLRPDQ